MSREADKESFQLLMSVGPAPRLPGKFYFYQGESDLLNFKAGTAFLPSRSTHCISASLANKLKEIFQTKDQSLPKFCSHSP